jgi:hypothetical protein
MTGRGSNRARQGDNILSQFVAWRRDGEVMQGCWCVFIGGENANVKSE